MSDSDEDFMPNNVLKYQHERIGIHTQGPNRNTNNTHITSFSIRNNNMMTSTFDMQNYERQRYRGAFDQRSMCYRRETSPMSLRSFPDPGMNNFHNSYYPRGMSSQRSVFNGRSGSPMSVRSIDSNASVVSAADIALAFKNVKFNKYDLRLIKEAYCKFMKNRVRKRVEKRRNLKLFLKGTRKDTGYDSGELGSDSSISSDDCRSTRTTFYKENLPVPRSKPIPLKTDMTQLRNTIQESDMYQDCTENFKQNSLRNMLNVKKTQMNISGVTNTTIAKTQNSSQVNLKDRFAKGNSFVLSSQRFTKPENKTKNGISRILSSSRETRQTKCNLKETVSNKSFESNSGNEEIFSEVTVRENVQESTLQRKRNLDLEERNSNNIKRKKLMSPIKNTSETLISSTLTNTQNNDFTFKKPLMPLRKSTKVKDAIFNDKLIAKSAPPLVDDFEPDFSLHSNKQTKNKHINLQHLSMQQVPQNKETDDINNETEILQNTTDVSMKPSFIKRKLFSQKLDVLDKKNQSTDNLALNSPQTKLYAGEKHKVRKLASSQSCLNLDVLGEDNVLDLIHKIVPRDKMNITNAQNKKDTRKSQDDDKWDVTSVISMCNNDDVSDTYTDEEIFKISQSTTNNKANNVTNNVRNVTSETNQPIQSNKGTKPKSKEMPMNKNITKNTKPVDCKVILKKLSPKILNDQAKPIQNQNKRTVSNCVKTFWDTDFESDMEERPHFTRNSKFAAGKDHENNPAVNNTINLTKKNGLKGTILTVRSTQNKGVNSISRSDKSRVSQRKNQNENQEIKEQMNETTNKKFNCKVNLNASVTEVKNKRGRQKSKDSNISNSVQKCTSKSKETCKKPKKCDAVKKNETNKIRKLTPRKVNENKRQSSPKSNESSFNCSNISSRSLRCRKKPTDYRC